MDNFKDKIEIVCPKHKNLQRIFSGDTLKPFDQTVVSFIQLISSTILKDISLKKYPELKALAFWMRNANIQKMKTDFFSNEKDFIKVPRGIAFHIAPANVDTIFVYSWFLSMLAGNINIIRLPSNPNEQINTLMDIINKIVSLKQFTKIQETTALIRYEHNDEITEYFSKRCNTRIIWGGDETVKKIRSLELNSIAKEIIFPDRFSYTLIRSAELIKHKDISSLVNNFYNDAFWFDQNACSSPKLIIWCGAGTNRVRAQKIFWKELTNLTEQKDQALQQAVAINKLLSITNTVMEANKEVKVETGKSNFINRIFIESLDDIKRENHCGGGLFYETNIKNLIELKKFLRDKDQTLTVFGFSKEEIEKFVKQTNPRGISRIVPFGQALNFSALWDGFNLLDEFTRKVELII